VFIRLFRIRVCLQVKFAPRFLAATPDDFYSGLQRAERKTCDGLYNPARWTQEAEQSALDGSSATH
jgi:hypothetical protein